MQSAKDTPPGSPVSEPPHLTIIEYLRSAACVCDERLSTREGVHPNDDTEYEDEDELTIIVVGLVEGCGESIVHYQKVF